MNLQLPLTRKKIKATFSARKRKSYFINLHLSLIKKSTDLQHLLNPSVKIYQSSENRNVAPYDGKVSP